MNRDNDPTNPRCAWPVPMWTDEVTELRDEAFARVLRRIVETGNTAMGKDALTHLTAREISLLWDVAEMLSNVGRA